MSLEPASPEFLWELFCDLRRRKFPLGLSDYDDLRTALRQGFGWSSHEALVELCCTLWAKSRRDADVIRALFTQHDAPEWTLAEPKAPPPETLPGVTPPAAEPPIDRPANQPPTEPEAVAVEKTGGCRRSRWPAWSCPRRTWPSCPAFR